MKRVSCPSCGKKTPATEEEIEREWRKSEEQAEKYIEKSRRNNEKYPTNFKSLG